MNKKEYRKREFEKISTIYNEWNTKVKFVKPNGETNYMDITNRELERIINLLTDYELLASSNGEFELIKLNK